MNIFSIYYGSGVMRRYVYSSAVFTWSRPLSLKFYLNRVISINRSWRQKTRHWATTRCLRSVVLTQYRRVTDRRTGRGTDGPICRSTYSACKTMLCGVL